MVLVTRATTSWEKRIDHAEGNAQRQAKYKTRLIRLDVTIEPAVRTGCCFRVFQNEGVSLRGLFYGSSQICVAADNSQ
jgi:hypothetical protein